MISRPSVTPFAMNSPDPAPSQDEIRKAAQGFESLFLASLMKSARASLPGESLTGGAGVDMAQDLLDQQLSRIAGARAGFGLADAIARQLAPRSEQK